MTETLLARSLRLAREIGSGGEQSPPSRVTRLVRIFDGVTQVQRPQVLSNRPSREQWQAERRRSKGEIIRRGIPLYDGGVISGLATCASPTDEIFEERAEPARRMLVYERIDPQDMCLRDGYPAEWEAPPPEAWPEEVREIARAHAIGMELDARRL